MTPVTAKNSEAVIPVSRAEIKTRSQSIEFALHDALLDDSGCVVSSARPA